MTQDNTVTPQPQTTAADVYEADLEEPQDQNVLEKAGRFVAGVAAMAFGDDASGFSGVGVVVRRKDDGSVLLRLDAGNYESDQILLDTVREAMTTSTPEEFVSEWGSSDEDAPTPKE